MKNTIRSQATAFRIASDLRKRSRDLVPIFGGSGGQWLYLPKRPSPGGVPNDPAGKERTQERRKKHACRPHIDLAALEESVHGSAARSASHLRMLVEEVYVLDEHQASLARTSGLPDDDGEWDRTHSGSNSGKEAVKNTGRHK